VGNDTNVNAPQLSTVKDAHSTDAAAYQEYTVIWSRLTFWDKLRFFRWWVLCTFIAIITNVIACILRLVHSYDNNQMGAADDQTTMWLDSIGITLLYVQVLHYIEHRAEYFQIVATLQIGIPRVLKFLVGVAPLLIAYNFVGMIFFSNYSPFFANFGAGMITLFAVMNGDEVADAFDQVTSAQPIMAQIYWYTYICLFIFVVLNIFISIIEAAHEITELRHHAIFGGNVHESRRPITQHLLKEAMKLLDADNDDRASAETMRTRDNLISVAGNQQKPISSLGILNGLNQPNYTSGNDNEQHDVTQSRMVKASTEASPEHRSAVNTKSLLSVAFSGTDEYGNSLGNDANQENDLTLTRLRQESFHGNYGEEKQAAFDALMEFARR
jgi:hypothetical protein